MTDYTPGPWRVEKPEDDLIKWRNHAIGARPTISIWADSTQKELYHEIALVADDDLANAELIASAPRLKQERDELLAVLKRIEPHLDAIICYASTMSEHEPNAIAQQARELIERIDRE